MVIKLKDSEECRLEFTHLNGKPSSLYIACNPLTGKWLQDHTIGEQSTAYYGTKADAVSLANSIVRKSASNNLPCKVIIQPRSVMKD
jgi:hypothetical protein